MTDISIQFHAVLDEELLPWVARCANELDLHLAALAWPPFRVTPLPLAELASVAADESIHTLALSLTPPVLPAKTSGDFQDHNPDALLVELGRVKGGGLKESGLSARTSSAEALQAWKKVASSLKAMTRAGVTAVNPKTGEKARLRSHRYTEGVKRLQLQGMKMLPIAGTAELELDE
ncbi:MAG TPA: hypothetical protein VJN18_04095 [Polyangiaceae bacterium]|nr:hypothetical protein [Polyangiaceae bacterium]